MSKIAVIGLGQGGAVATLKLAEQGHDVDVFEKDEKGFVGYDWYDDIRFDVFDICSIPAPPESAYTQKSKWLFVSPDEKNGLKVPPAKPMEEVSISRRGLSAHFDGLLNDAGVRIYYGACVQALVIREEKVVGVTVCGEEYVYDLVIDASGLNSPFRGQVPSKFGVQAKPDKNDIMKGYRAFYKRKEGSVTPNPESTLYIKHLNGVGISWCNLNDRNEVDVLIGRIGTLTNKEIEDSLGALYRNHDILTEEEIRSPRKVDIGVRRPLSVMVADGYVAVGDSAFMTMPIMGSGIEASMKAGVWLAETLNGKTDFSAKELWGYELKFIEELGADYMFIDIIKRWALNINPAMINWLFGCGVVTNDDMALLSTDSENPAKISALDVLKKALIILRKPSLVCQAVKWLVKALGGKRIAKRIPKKYNRGKVVKWAKKYDGIIAKIER